MKTFKFLKSIVPFVALSFCLLTSCDKDKNDGNVSTYKVSGDASGAQVVPAFFTTATATLTGTYDARTNSLIYNISWTDLSSDVISINIYGPAAAGVNGAALQPLNITTNGTAGVAAGTLTLTDAQETALLAGNVYYNIQTLNNTSGEIRGQIVTVIY
jgi:hypothetical protein